VGGPFGWEEFGEYFSEEPSADTILINPITEPTVVRSPLLQDLDIQVPFRAAATSVFSMVVESHPMQATQVPVEVVASPNANLNLTQGPVEVAVRQDPYMNVTQAPIEVVVVPDNPFMQVTQVPVEVVRRELYELVTVVWWD
jgi:hypothetical protein